ncbi:MAG: hypothetical protein AAGG06_12260 [Pseudomonadota bacterium]
MSNITGTGVDDALNGAAGGDSIAGDAGGDFVAAAGPHAVETR